MGDRHVLLVAFPIHGQITPSIRLAMRLLDRGIKVTFASSVYAQQLAAKAIGGNMPNDLTYASIPDGYDDGLNIADVNGEYMTEFRSQASEVMKDVISKSAEVGFPVTCLIYTILLPWASEVAREHRIPCMLLWIQAATVLNIHYYYFNGFADEIMETSNSKDLRLPRLPLSLSKHDLPSFILPPRSDNDSAFLENIKEHLETLDSEAKPRVLVNTFDALESDALKAIEKYELIGIGPLIPPAFLGGKDDCGEWLSSKQEASVVYVSFGSLLTLENAQMEEIARGLRESGRPFLWVIREMGDDSKQSLIEGFDGETGKIVPWCSQLEVLAHSSVGCFVTHCGWNSTLESVWCGVPVVAFPQWVDQGTNAKLIEDVWRNGVRVRVRGNEEGLVESGEVRRCIEEVIDGWW